MQSIDSIQSVSHEAPTAPCASCGAGEIRVFHEVRNVPVQSCLLIATREEALRFPRGDIQLGFCTACGFISNLRFEPELLDYCSSYEETQGFSAHFNAFASRLARDMID